MTVAFHQAGRREWRRLERGGLTADFAGREATVAALLDRLRADAAPRPEDLDHLLRGLPGHYAACVRGPGWVLAAVDTVRSFPLFHARGADGLHLSGCARAARDAAGLGEPDPDGLLEFLMAGYVTGPDTVLRGLSQLQAGEALLWREAEDETVVHRYYRFHSLDFSGADEAELIRELGRATDAVFDRLVEDLDGRPAWVPLSAGLDSRLVAAKLAERGCPRVQTFSYGVAGNHEARHAARVAGALGLPWRFVPTTGAMMRSFHESPRRREYWDYCDGLSTVPNPQDIVPLLALREQGALPDDAVLINGQSGDFICGAHIPEALTRPGATVQILCERAVAKHFALWRDLATPDNTARITARMRTRLADIDPDPRTPDALCVLHDCWEWQERQAKYVVAGQRIYDFLGLDWRLPLWELEWMDFWPHVPVAHRMGRSLHRKYLAAWDFRGLFSGPEPVVRHWPGASVAWFLLAQAVGLFGRGAKDAWYRHVRWFGHYGFQWHSYPLGRFLRDANQARNLLALYGEDWVSENFGLADRHAAARAGGGA